MAKNIIKKVGIILAAFVVIAVSFLSGVFLGTQKNNPQGNTVIIQGKMPLSSSQSSTDFALFWDVWSRLEDKYVDRQKIDRQKLVFGAIDGMVKSLGDPYTVFFPPEEAKRFNDDIHGEFGGIGAEIGMRKGILTVISPLKDSPSERAGILAGDKILKINSTSTLDLTLEEAVAFIRGEKGTPVILSILHEKSDSAKEVKITRDTIKIPVTETKKLDGGIYYIHLFNFNENSPQEFRRGLIDFYNSGATKLILDLRNNPGGFLQAAVDIASWFLPEGEVVAREHFSIGEEQLYRSFGYRMLERTP
ncbi:MAG: PDZ domain-containing protein, partial [Candidatus Sungbacteria bacterium]|nr:PDZ domain-containing protein [Candidatus Sungbacteria bacterium]